MGMGVKLGWRVGLGVLAALTVALIPAGIAFATTSGKTPASSTSTSTSQSNSTSTTATSTANPPPTTTTTFGGAPTTFTFTGALKGTLHIIPMDNCSAA